MLYSMYPSQVSRWISNRGGLSPRMFYRPGRQLKMMYRPCYLDARVAAATLNAIEEGSRRSGAGRVFQVSATS